MRPVQMAIVCVAALSTSASNVVAAQNCRALGVGYVTCGSWIGIYDRREGEAIKTLVQWAAGYMSASLKSDKSSMLDDAVIEGFLNSQCRKEPGQSIASATQKSIEMMEGELRPTCE